MQDGISLGFHSPLVTTLLHLVTGCSWSIMFGFGTVSQSTVRMLEAASILSLAQLGSVRDLH